MRKLTLVSFYYNGVYHSHFVMASYDPKGKATISTKVLYDLIMKSGLAHLRISRQ